MILIDTNVLSELMRPAPAPAVIAWMDAHSAGALVCATTLAEINLGIELLPEGKRRDMLAASARQMFEEDFSGRVLAFDAGAAVCFARIVAMRRKIGRPISTQDAEIAAIALARGHVLATRNLDDFRDIPGAKADRPVAGDVATLALSPR